MRKNIAINAGYLASALGVLMSRQGMTEFKFTKEEYQEIYERGQYIKLQGDFVVDGEPPEYLVFTMLSRADYIKETN